MSLSIIRILGAEVYAYHGVTAEEQAVGGRYGFDLEFETDITDAAETDDLNHTIDYSKAFDTACGVLTGTSRNLLETLATDIAHQLLAQFPKAQAVTVRLRKYSVPIEGILRAAEVEIRKQQVM